MADPLSIGTGIVGVIGLAIQIMQGVVQFGLDWKDAPHDVKGFVAELQALKTTLSEMNTNLLLNSDFTEAFQNRSSLLLSELGPDASPTTDTKMMLKVCEKELKDLLRELGKRAKAHRVGWERLKGAFRAKSTRESVEKLHRWCQELNSMVSIDTAVLGATTYKEVKEARQEQQEARKEQQEALKEQQAWQQRESKVSLTVKDGVDQINQEQESLQRQQERRVILEWLTSNDHASQQSDIINKRQEGTGLWLLDSDQFRTWLDQSDQTLFCQGIPGAGKTMSAAITIDKLSAEFQAGSNVGIAYVYCNFRRRHEQKPIDLFASLLKQLTQGRPSVPQSMQRLYEKHQHKQTRPSIDEVSQALQLTVRDYSKVFIIVDALDEFQVSDGRKQFLAELFNLQTKTAANLFVTSRFIPEIEKEFDGKSTKLEIRASDEDLLRYLDGHILKLPSFVSRNADLQKEIKTAIVKVVDGMFLLAQLHFDSLIGKRSPKAIRRALEKLPKGSEAYDQAYREAMERIEGQVTDSEILAKQVLSWITCAKRPLTILELQHALTVEIGEPELDNENLPEIEDIVSVCAGMITVDEESNIIRLVHYTTQEFFERTQREWFPKAEADIANVCITYLSFDIFEAGFCRSDEGFEARIQSNPLYDYAARNWGHHLLKSDVQCPNVEFLESEAKVSASSQAMMVSRYRYFDYSQQVPQQIRGVHLAAWFGLTEMVSVLVESRHGSDCKDSNGRTPLSYAALNGHETIVELLIEREDVEADSKDQSGQTPLSYAALNGHEATVKLLIKRENVEADLKDQNGRTPLFYAALNGHEAIVKLLIERKDVEADSKDQSGQTPLSYAALNGHEATVKLLIKRENVEADSKDQSGRTPLLYAAWNGHEAIVELLVEQEDVEADSKDQSGQTPLSYAALNGHEAIVELLVEQEDVEADSKDQSGQTPLSYAAWNGHEAIVELLVKQEDVEADSKDQSGQTPLSYAALNGHEAIVKLLIEREDVEADSKDQYGRTPLSYAAWNGHEAIVKLLVEQEDVEADSKDQSGRTPLSYAAWNGHEAIVELLIKREDVEADSKDQYGRTPLSYAAVMERKSWTRRENQEAVVELLLKEDCVNANTRDINGRTALSWVAGEGHFTRAKLFFAKDGIDRACKDTDSRTPLSWAAARGHDAIMTLLLTADGIDPNSRDRYGQTPLLLAAGNGHEAAVKLLLAEDAVDSGSKDNFGRTPLIWAARKGYSSIVRLLREKYQTDGGVIHEENLDIAVCSVTEDESSKYCDICLSWIPNVNIHYHCGICRRGDFDLCQECLGYEAFCFDQSHELTKQRVETMKL